MTNSKFRTNNFPVRYSRSIIMGGYPALSSTKFISEYVWLQWLRDVLSKSFISSDDRKQNTALTSSIHVESLGSRGGYTHDESEFIMGIPLQMALYKPRPLDARWLLTINQPKPQDHWTLSEVFSHVQQAPCLNICLQTTTCISESQTEQLCTPSRASPKRYKRFSGGWVALRISHYASWEQRNSLTKYLFIVYNWFN